MDIDAEQTINPERPAPNLEWAGKSALVYGGAQGLGVATTRLLLERGAWVTVADLAPESVQDLLEDETLSGRIQAIRCDVSQRESVEKALALHLNSFGTLDAAIDSAGIQRYGALETPRANLGQVDPARATGFSILWCCHTGNPDSTRGFPGILNWHIGGDARGVLGSLHLACV